MGKSVIEAIRERGKSLPGTVESARLRRELQRLFQQSPDVSDPSPATLSELWWIAGQIRADIDELVSSGKREHAAGVLVDLGDLDSELPRFRKAAELVVGGPLLERREVVRYLAEDLEPLT